MQILLPVFLVLVATTASADEFRTVTDHFDREVVVPASPMRIVSLSESATAIMIDFGIAPIGSMATTKGDTGEVYFPGLPPAHISFDSSSIEPIFWPADMEYVLSLEPDLIVAGQRKIEAGEQLSSIAPTFFFAEDSEPWITQRQIADAIGVTDKFERRRALYYARLERLKDRLQIPDGSTYNILEIIDNGLMVRELYGVNHVLEDLGLERNLAMARIEEEDLFWVSRLSWESLAEVEADYLFIPFEENVWGTLDFQLSTLERNIPDWCQFLPACREDRIVFLNREVVAQATFTHLHNMLSIVGMEAARRHVSASYSSATIE